MNNEIKVKVLNSFKNPINGKQLKVDQVLNVPHNGFWIKRIEQKDVEQIKVTKKKAPTKVTAKNEKGVK